MGAFLIHVIGPVLLTMQVIRGILLPYFTVQRCTEVHIMTDSIGPEGRIYREGATTVVEMQGKTYLGERDDTEVVNPRA